MSVYLIQTRLNFETDFLSQNKLKARDHDFLAQKFGTRWWSRVRTKAIMAAKSCKKMYGDKETSSNILIMSLRVIGARLETC